VANVGESRSGQLERKEIASKTQNEKLERRTAARQARGSSDGRAKAHKQKKRKRGRSWLAFDKARHGGFYMQGLRWYDTSRLHTEGELWRKSGKTNSRYCRR